MDSKVLFQCQRFEHPPCYPTPLHVHTLGQLCRIEAGLLMVETSVGRWVVPPGWLGWIPAGLSHSAWSQTSVRGRILYMPQVLCKGLPQGLRVLAPEPVRDAVFGRLSGMKENVAKRSASRLLAVLCDELATASAAPLELPMPSDPRLRRVVMALLDTPDDERTAQAWASLVGMGVRTLSRRFVKETGMNFVHWRQLARLHKALTWLENGRPVGWVAQSCGYASTSAFIKVYRRYLGGTPAHPDRV